MEPGEIVKLIVGAIVVILAAYYATYFVANRKIKRTPGRGINVRERFSLSKDKMVCVVEANGKAYLVVVTNGGATLLDTFEAQEFETAAELEKPAYPQQQGYVPNGIIARGIWRLFNSFRNAASARTSPAYRGQRADADMFVSPENQDSRRERTEFTIRTAREEDGIDEIQRRLKNRMAASSNPEEAPDDE